MKKLDVAQGSGFFCLPEADYHADPCLSPSLSASIAHKLLSRSPKHAWFSHPKLNPDWKPSEPTAGMDLGSAIHRMLLESRTDGIVIVHADNWRTGAAREQRALARKSGAIPLLVADFEEASTIVAAARAQILGTELAVFDAGDAELSMLWQDRPLNTAERDAAPIWCRSRLDFVSTDRRLIVDLKCTAASAAPAAVIRRIIDDGWGLQLAFYRRGVQALSGVVAQCVLLVVETVAPYALSMIGLNPSWVDLESRRVDAAIGSWSDCLSTGDFPGYPPRVAWCAAPAWYEARMMEAELEQWN